MIPCKMCGGAAHPATGCEYGSNWLVCWRCTIEDWKWLRNHINSKGGRKGLYFYEHTAHTCPKSPTQTKSSEDSKR